MSDPCLTALKGFLKTHTRKWPSRWGWMWEALSLWSLLLGRPMKETHPSFTQRPQLTKNEAGEEMVELRGLVVTPLATVGSQTLQCFTRPGNCHLPQTSPSYRLGFCQRGPEAGVGDGLTDHSYTHSVSSYRPVLRVLHFATIRCICTHVS
jgi:hypothetical protein